MAGLLFLATFYMSYLFLPILGGANLHVNVSVVLTGESFHPDFTSKGSEMFNNKTSWIEAQVCSS